MGPGRQKAFTAHTMLRTRFPGSSPASRPAAAAAPLVPAPSHPTGLPLPGSGLHASLTRSYFIFKAKQPCNVVPMRTLGLRAVTVLKVTTPQAHRADEGLESGLALKLWF